MIKATDAPSSFIFSAIDIAAFAPIECPIIMIGPFPLFCKRAVCVPKI